MDEPNVVSVIDQMLNRLALFEKKRPLTQAEELQKQPHIDFKIRAEQNQLTKVTKEDGEKRTGAKNRALKLIQELRQQGSGVS